MHFELTTNEFNKVYPLLEKCQPDPMLHTVLEKNQPGRVFVDHRESPTCAYIWPLMEYSYIVGQRANPTYYQALHETIEAEILPAMEQAGMGFISIIPCEEFHQKIFLELFADRHPLSLGVNTFTFDEARFRELQPTMIALPAGVVLCEMDRSILQNPANQHTLEDIEYCWGSVEQFLEKGLGICVLSGGKIVSCCYAIAFGADAYHVNIWTAHPQQRKGFARTSCAVFIQRCLRKGRSLYWLCDRHNLGSRRLAESLGYTHRSDLYPVDVPCDPPAFYQTLGEHFLNTLQHYKYAGEFFEKAFALGNQDKEMLYRAAVAWALAGDEENALNRLADAAR